MGKKKQAAPSQDDSSQILDIVDLTNVVEIEQLTTLRQIIQEQKEHIIRLEKELDVLKHRHSTLHVEDEETIATLQLERLKSTALERELTLEEVKKFDLLVKNKRLSNGKSTLNADYIKLPTEPQDLIQLATNRTSDEES